MARPQPANLRAEIGLGLRRISLLAFAGEVCLFARSRTKVQTMLSKLSQYLRSKGYNPQVVHGWRLSRERASLKLAHMYPSLISWIS